ncbi:MAG: glycosyltransferase family A protein [Patescibacteria group bacterium]
MISIIIPVYNRPGALKRSLMSVCRQTYKSIEIIVVDDGSNPAVELPITHFRTNNAIATTDEINSPSICRFSNDLDKEPEDRGKKIQLVRQQNKGAPAARNKGFELSGGEYVIFWDADVIAEPEMLEKMYNALQNNPSAGYAYSDFYFGNRKMPSQPFDADKLRKINYITTASLIRRKDFVGFDITLKKFQDWDLWLTMLSKERTGIYVPEYLFRILPGGTMSAWLPSFVYRAPWRWLPIIRGRVKKYLEAVQVILKKHGLEQ